MCANLKTKEYECRKVKTAEEDVVGMEKDVGRVPELPSYMAEVIDDLKRNEKFPAVHTYFSTCNSFARFCACAEAECGGDSSGEGSNGGSGARMALPEVFRAGRLKEYESWMMQRELSLNTVSTYMRTLRAVYNRWLPPAARNTTRGCSTGCIPKWSLAPSAP